MGISPGVSLAIVIVLSSDESVCLETVVSAFPAIVIALFSEAEALALFALTHCCLQVRPRIPAPPIPFGACVFGQL